MLNVWIIEGHGRKSYKSNISRNAAEVSAALCQVQIVLVNCGWCALFTWKEKDPPDCYLHNIHKLSPVMLCGVLVPMASPSEKFPPDKPHSGCVSAAWLCGKREQGLPAVQICLTLKPSGTLSSACEVVFAESATKRENEKNCQATKSPVSSKNEKVFHFNIFH